MSYKVMMNENMVIASAHCLLGPQWLQIEEEEEEEEGSATFVSCCLQVEGISETLVLFNASACCRMQENSNHHENGQLCKMQEVTGHESSSTGDSLRCVCVCDVKL